jgi:hypothetical protein
MGRRTSHSGGKTTRWRYRNRQITVKGPETASRLLVRIGDAVRFESCRNKVLEEMVEENKDKFTRYTVESSKADGDCLELDADPLPDPTAGLGTDEVAAMLVCEPMDMGATSFEGLKEESPGHFVCQWGESFPVDWRRPVTARDLRTARGTLRCV